MNYIPQSGLNLLAIFIHIVCIFLLPDSIHAQNIPASSKCPHNFTLLPSGRSEFHYVITRFNKEVALKASGNIDSLRYHGHKAICLADSANYKVGLINIYLGFGTAYADKYEIDSSKHYSKLAIQLSIATQDTISLIKSHLAYGWALIYDNSDYEGAIQNFLLANSLAKKIDNKELLTTSFTKLVKLYYYMNDFWKAYEICNELIKLNQNSGDIKATVSNYHMLSYIFSAINLHEKQMDIVREMLIMVDNVKDTAALYDIYKSAFRGYLNMKDYSAALHYARKLLPLAKAAKKEPICYGPIAHVYLETNQLDSARYYYETMLSKQRENGSYIDIYEYLDLGKIEFSSGNMPKALEYFNLAEANISKPPLFTQKEIYKALVKYYDVNGDHKKSHYYLKKYTRISDSLYAYNNSMIVGISVIDKEAKDLENQIALLIKDKELQSVIAAKETQKVKVIYGSMMLCLLTGVFGFIRYKKQKTIKAKQELLNERLRISRDLHDEVGSTLSGIAMYTHVAKSQIENAHHDLAQLSLSTMQNSANEMVAKLSDIVWLINPEQDSVAELLERVEQYAKQMAMARNMNVQIEIPNRMSKLHIPMEARRNIYLFCKESINNAVKYSKGSMIRIQVLAAADHFKFSVADDGIGFDELIVKRGNGLKNMRQRAEEIGATFHIESHPDRGSEVFLQYKVIQ